MKEAPSGVGLCKYLLRAQSRVIKAAFTIQYLPLQHSAGFRRSNGGLANEHFCIAVLGLKALASGPRHLNPLKF